MLKHPFPTSNPSLGTGRPELDQCVWAGVKLREDIISRPIGFCPVRDIRFAVRRHHSGLGNNASRRISEGADEIAAEGLGPQLADYTAARQQSLRGLVANLLVPPCRAST
jgi:hypothetical protein